MHKNLNIIAFDIPFPADYGGVIDIFFKIKELKKQGFKINLHCFQYGREKSIILSQLCKEVYYYPRKTYKNLLFGDIPYIVASRQSEELLQNIKNNNYPILFEGLHSTFLLKHPDLKNRLKIVRTHNIEHEYYKHLELAEKNFFKKYFFKTEAERLKKYQSILKFADLICAISPADEQYFKKKFGKTIYLPAFHNNEKVNIITGLGKYALYHGNLSVAENHLAAMFLTNEVFSKTNIPFIIAGSNPKKELKQAVSKYKNIELRANENTENIHNLISNAQINILYTRQNTGIKLKLLNSLYIGRHCIANSIMTDNTGLNSLCHIANTPEKIIEMLNKLMKTEFDINELTKRKKFFAENFNNSISANLLIENIMIKNDGKNEIPLQKNHTINKNNKLRSMLNIFTI
ncbi:MAG: glycosyltransferase [Bacteroidetes bacterium]|nr:glycosyltransferase [Bacteroidota bacterium]